jgi:hypothetical protein
MLMSLIVVLNGLLGAICGVWFRVKILIPLIAVVFIEMAIFKQTATWPSTFWLTITLIITVEISYLIGAAAGPLWLSRGRRGVIRDFTRHQHSRLTHH